MSGESLRGGRVGVCGARAVAACLALTLAPVARAQDADQERVAETLFQEGRSLVKAGRIAEACPKFAASQKASPSTGTQLNLADCLEKSGALASAWALYLDVARASVQDNRKDRETVAKTRAAALQPRLPKMRIAGVPSFALVRRNGAVVLPALLGSDEPIDPGRYDLEVSVDGKKAWSTTVTMTADAPEVVVTVPALEAVGSASTGAATLRPRSSVPEREPPTEPRASPLRAAALVVGAAGVVGLGVGAAFGAVAIHDQSSAGCPKNVCPNQADAQTIRSAQSAATVSTVAFVGGGVLAAAGIVFWIAAPDHGGVGGASMQFTPSVAPGGAGLNLRGAF